MACTSATPGARRASSCSRTIAMATAARSGGTSFSQSSRGSRTWLSISSTTRTDTTRAPTQPSGRESTNCTCRWTRSRSRGQPGQSDRTWATWMRCRATFTARASRRALLASRWTSTARPRTSSRTIGQRRTMCRCTFQAPRRSRSSGGILAMASTTSTGPATKLGCTTWTWCVSASPSALPPTPSLSAPERCMRSTASPSERASKRARRGRRARFRCSRKTCSATIAPAAATGTRCRSRGLRLSRPARRTTTTVGTRAHSQQW
mmetsp:Transcript_68179/g.162760  ORF Transcript_68179/g.162760 Transcript_68179/m.162760 type:complete len:264 (+) Transcript_68179:576-1367(+)